MKPYLFPSLLMLAYSCQNRNAAVKGKEWQLERVIKYKNLVDREGRLVRTKSTLFVYAEGQEVGTVKGDVTYFDYDSMGHRIAERSFDIEKNGNKNLVTEILNTYNEKGLLKSIIQKKFGLLLSSLLHQYDEKGRLKLVAQRSLRKWPSTPAEAAALTASSSLSYDTSFVAYAYNGEGQLILERRLNTQSVVTAATYYEYTDLELDRAYTLNEEKDTVTGLFYEKERDGTTKETAVYAGLDQTTTAWKNGDRILQEITLGMNGRSKHTYSYSKRGHLIEERTYH